MDQQKVRSSNCDCCRAIKNSNTPCSKALDRIHAMQAEIGKKDKDSNIRITCGCDWYVNSAEHGYCFWLLAEDLYGSPCPDKEICQLLGITPAQLKETYKSLVDKLCDKRRPKEIDEWIIAIREFVQSQDTEIDGNIPGRIKSDLTPDSEVAALIGEGKQSAGEETNLDLLIEEIDAKSKRKIRKGFGLPLHRDGKKVDLYGLSSKNKYKAKKPNNFGDIDEDKAKEEKDEKSKNKNTDK